MNSRSINVKEACFSDFSASDKEGSGNEVDYTGLLMNVPLEVRVQIGKTKRTMREVLKFAQGSIIKLDKQAGAPVEIIANDQTVARGDVIVIDEHFGVRITEIITTDKHQEKPKDKEEITEETPAAEEESPEAEETEENTEETEE